MCCKKYSKKDNLKAQNWGEEVSIRKATPRRYKSTKVKGEIHTHWGIMGKTSFPDLSFSRVDKAFKALSCMSKSKSSSLKQKYLLNRQVSTQMFLDRNGALSKRAIKKRFRSHL